jgi:AbrB family looped-hinge helix DNA binding protein
MSGDTDEENERPRTRVSEKGQTTIPKRFREELGLTAGDEVEWVRTSDGVEARKASKSGRGTLLADADEETRRAVFEDLSEQNRKDRESAAWNTGT